MIADYNVNLKNKTKNELILFIKELQDMLKEKDKQIAKYEKIYRKYDCYRWVKELEKKDKMINKMIEAVKAGKSLKSIELDKKDYKVEGD